MEQDLLELRDGVSYCVEAIRRGRDDFALEGGTSMNSKA